MLSVILECLTFAGFSRHLNAALRAENQPRKHCLQVTKTHGAGLTA